MSQSYDAPIGDHLEAFVNIPEAVGAILRDPVTLETVDAASVPSSSGKFLELRSGGLSRKNEREIEHFRRTFKPLPPFEKLYSRKISSLPAPETGPDTVVLDIGCGPYDCLSAMPGTHVFLDDIMNLYVDEIGAVLDGTPVCARTELMPFAADSIELLYSVNMLDHVDDMPATVAEMHRILAPGGRIYCQSYFNSHPLLDTEPGVFDRTFYDDYVLPLFEVDHVATYAVGDPAISRSYTMDIIGLVLKKRVGATVETKPRERYLDASYMGPQSHISVAVGALKEGDPDQARPHVEALANEPFYDLQHQLLRAHLAIVEGDPGAANSLLKDLGSWERVKKNPLARVAVAQLQTRRVSSQNVALRAQNKAIKSKNGDLTEQLAAAPKPASVVADLETLGRKVLRRGRAAVRRVSRD